MQLKGRTTTKFGIFIQTKQHREVFLQLTNMTNRVGFGKCSMDVRALTRGIYERHEEIT
jgi:hypothetical protein